MTSKLEVLATESTRWDDFVDALEVALMEHGCDARTS